MNNSDEVYIRNFKKGEKEILFFGCIHSKSNEQLNKIKEIVFNFNPDIILVEGNYHLADFKSEKDSIEIGREMGYTSFLAKEKNIKLDSNDPSFSEDILFIEKNYTKEIAFAYFFLRNRNSNLSEERAIKDIK